MKTKSERFGYIVSGIIILFISAAGWIAGAQLVAFTFQLIDKYPMIAITVFSILLILLLVYAAIRLIITIREASNLFNELFKKN